MKVYVYTKAPIFQPEQYIGVKATKKEAEKALRDMYPHMKQDDNEGFTFASDASETCVLFIRAEEI